MGMGVRRLSGFLRRCISAERFTLAIVQVGFFVAASAAGGAQASSPEAQMSMVLGPHSDGTRGCEVCHVPRVAPYGGEADATAEKVPKTLWGQSGGPAYGPMVSLVDGMRLAEVHPERVASSREEALGILLCLSCHDGSLTPQNMMQGWSYERQMGLLASTPYRDVKIPTLLGETEVPAQEHPLGVAAQIPDGGGLVWANGTFSVTPRSPYAQFVANYGAPALLSSARTAAYGVNHDGAPYALCTTCHDQHVNSVFASGAGNPIAGDGGGKVYTTFFFVNGPYNPKIDKLAQQNASSAAQFCRQCHFEVSNEANNANHVPTAFF